MLANPAVADYIKRTHSRPFHKSHHLMVTLWVPVDEAGKDQLASTLIESQKPNIPV